jgi:fructose-bisphosphate aldolase, class I
MLDLTSRAKKLTCAPKGILAADESNESANKRLKLCGIESTAETRRQYRELFLDAPQIEDYLTGVILYSETLEQKDSDGEPFPALLLRRGIMPGIKVDEGTEPMPESPDEFITKGLIGLPERLTKYVKEHDTQFTKWRAVIKIDGDRLPTSGAILENARRLASYARMVQEAGMVPMLEPEVLYDGTHSLIRSKEVITDTLHTLIATLKDGAVDLSAIVIKTSMALSGKDTGRIDSPEEVAQATIDALLETVPREVPGIVFLSGGQEDDQATENLRAIHRYAKEKKVPWNITFSYARAIQEDALTAWKCLPQNVPEARKAYMERLKGLHGALEG